MEYKLTLNEQQYQCIIAGMEFYHRILCGQVSELNNIVPHRLNADTMHEVKKQLFPELSFGESYGWNGGHKNRYVDVMQAQSYQIYREMRHFATKQSGRENVYTGETLKSEKAEKPKIEIINSKKMENKIKRLSENATLPKKGKRKKVSAISQRSREVEERLGLSKSKTEIVSRSTKC